MTLTQAYAQGQTADPIETTIGQRLNEIAAAQPNHPGLIMPHQNIRWSYAEFLTEVDKLVTGLLKLGLTSGDRVAIWSQPIRMGTDPIRYRQNRRHYGVYQSGVSTLRTGICPEQSQLQSHHQCRVVQNQLLP